MKKNIGRLLIVVSVIVVGIFTFVIPNTFGYENNSFKLKQNFDVEEDKMGMVVTEVSNYRYKQPADQSIDAYDYIRVTVSINNYNSSLIKLNKDHFSIKKEDGSEIKFKMTDFGDEIVSSINVGEKVTGNLYFKGSLEEGMILQYKVVNLENNNKYYYIKLV